jgi:RNA polymerase sigma-70 factor (ECF subfamily)
MSALTERHQAWLESVVSDHADRSFDERGSRAEARELLDWALDRLSPKDRMVLELIYLEGLSVKEAAALTGWSKANVKVRSFRSRRKLQKVLTDIMDR